MYVGQLNCYLVIRSTQRPKTNERERALYRYSVDRRYTAICNGQRVDRHIGTVPLTTVRQSENAVCCRVTSVRSTHVVSCRGISPWKTTSSAREYVQKSVLFLFVGLRAPALTSGTACCAAGGSLDIRKAAAEQVASIAQTHPVQLPSLLRHVSAHHAEHKCKPLS